MAEAFGLDRRIENYQGKRPIGLFSWDFDCLLAVIEDAFVSVASSSTMVTNVESKKTEIGSSGNCCSITLKDSENSSSESLIMGTVTSFEFSLDEKFSA